MVFKAGFLGDSKQDMIYWGQSVMGIPALDRGTKRIGVAVTKEFKPATSHFHFLNQS